MVGFVNFQVVGVDKTDSSDHKKIRRMIISHYEKIRDHAIYGRCHVMVYFECQTHTYIHTAHGREAIDADEGYVCM